LITAALLVPPLLALATETASRQSNPNGSTSTVNWLDAANGGYGDYHIAAFVSMSFVTVYDTAGYVLVICNLILAVAASTAIVIAVFRVKVEQKEVKEIILPVKTSSKRSASWLQTTATPPMQPCIESPKV
jgi:hypothetical protein